MRRRSGFRNFIRTVEGVPPSVGIEHYELPRELPRFPLADVIWREVRQDTDNFWLLHAFQWRNSLGGHNFWEAIYHNSASEDECALANKYIRSWSEQTYVQT